MSVTGSAHADIFDPLDDIGFRFLTLLVQVVQFGRKMASRFCSQWSETFRRRRPRSPSVQPR